MINGILNLFRWQKMIKKEEILGDIPSNRAIYRHTLDIAWPSALESVLIALIGAVDTAMVGTIGKEAISAVGICGQPKFIILAPTLALNIGVTVLVSRRKGEQNQEAANHYMASAVFVSLIMTVILSLLGILFARPFLLLAGAGLDYIDLAVTYFRFIMIGNMFYATGLTLTAAQRGVGNTRISMITNLTANLVNLFFNAMLINGLFFFPKWGVLGAAVATMIGNIVSFIIACVSVSHKDHYLYLRLKEMFHPRLKDLGDIWQISKNSLVEQVFLRIGFFTYVKAVASLGTTSYAAHMVAMNVMVISFGLGEGLQIANTSLVGQSMGQRRVDMAKIYTSVSQRIGILIAIALSIVITIFSDPIAGFFTSDMGVIKACEVPLMILSFTILFQIPQVITVGALRGAGDVRFVAALMLVSVTLVRPILTYILAYPVGLGLTGAWIALFVDQITRNVLSSLRFRKGAWKQIVL